MPHKPNSVFSLLRVGESARQFAVAVGAGLVVAALGPVLPSIFGAVSPALQAMLNPIVTAVPWWLSLPIAFFAVFGFVSMLQRLGAARTRPPTGGSIALASSALVEKASPALLRIELRRSRGVVLSQGAMAQQLWVYLRLTNFASYPLRVRHISIDVWFGQPTLKLTLDRPFEIPPRSVRDDVGLNDIPDEKKLAKIDQYLASDYGGKALLLYVTVVCESDGGPLDRTEGIEVREPELSLVARSPQ